MKKVLNTCLILSFLLLVACSNVFAEAIPQGYKNLLQTYRDTLENGTYDSDNLGIFPTGMTPYGDYAMNNCGYELLDLNGDGTQELLIGMVQGANLTALYTLEEGQPKLLEKVTYYEERLAIMSDLPQNPTISNTITKTSLLPNSGNEDIVSVTKFYRLEGTNLQFVMSYAQNYTQKKYWSSTDENNMYQTEIPAIPEEAGNVRENNGMIPFGNYANLPEEGPEGSIYRVYNPNTGEHLYTLWFNEATELCQSGSWRNEGISWTSPATSDTPIYRLYNAGIDDHLYTSDPHEVQVLTTEQNWVADNEGNPVFYSGGEVPIYRLYNPSNYRHLLTRDENEFNTLPQLGWTQEGIALNALS